MHALDSAIRTANNYLLVAELHRHRVLLRGRQALELLRQVPKYALDTDCTDTVRIGKRTPRAGDGEDVGVEVDARRGSTWPLRLLLITAVTVLRLFGHLLLVTMLRHVELQEALVSM